MATTLADDRALLVEQYARIRSMLERTTANTGFSKTCRERILELTDYNLKGGKLNRGTFVISSFRQVLQRPLSQREVERAALLGWCVEWVQASFLVADDIMDQAETRRGKPCWYKTVGISAVNDAMLLMTQVNLILREEFAQDSPKLFIKLEALLTDTIYRTELGQFLDMQTQPPEGEICLDDYTMERYNEIVQFKTAYYSFYAPVALGLILAGIEDEKVFTNTRAVCLALGRYFQVQDDYLDCYGTPEQIGKIGTDIVDGKCSWLVVQALSAAGADERAVLEAHYAKKDAKSEEKVKALFEKLNLSKKYAEFELQSQEEIRAMIERHFGTSESVPKEVFLSLLQKISKRKS